MDTSHLFHASHAAAINTTVGRVRDYRQYPVFSWPWFWGRTRLFAVLGLSYTWLSGAAIGAVLNDWWFALGPTAVHSVQVLFTVWIGTFLATLVRHRHWPQQTINRAMVGAVLLGVMLSMIAQFGVNLYLEKFVSPRLVAANWTGSATLVREKPLGTVVVTVTSYLLLYSLLSGALALRAYLAEQREAAQAKQQRELAHLKLQKHESDLQLAILQAQIEPHFLFNTLASVRSLVTQDQTRAAAMIDGLANYLRATLPKLRTNSMSTLGEQLDICTSYLELMSLRMGERFSFSMAVDRSLFEIPVPPLLLLPLIENAVTHGIEPKAGSVTIRLSAQRDGDALRISIDDDGVGLAGHAAVQEIGKGIGLANIRSQLNLRYGVRAQLEVISRIGGGTSALLMLPIERPS